MSDLPKKRISLVTAVLISVIVTAAVVGSAVYVLMPKPVAPGEVTLSDVEDFLAGADRSVVERIAETIPQDILAEMLKTTRQVTVGFIWSFPHDGSGWCAGSEVSMNWMLERYPFIEGYRTEDIGPEEVNSVARSMIETQGAEMIFNNDEFIALPMFEINTDYPGVYFHTMVSGDIQQDRNFIRSYAKIYQAAYLCGLMAGALTETNAIGSVWSYPVSFLTRMVNAFALGVQEVNPDAKVYGGYVQSWYDPPVEREVATTLIDTYNCDVMMTLTDSPVPAEVASERGLWAFAAYGDQVQLGWLTEEDLVTCFIYQRHVFWDQILKEYLAGIEYPRTLYVAGYEGPLITPDGPIYPIDLSMDGRVGMEGISGKAKAALPTEILDLIEMRRNQMIEGTFDPFRDYRLVDVDGNVRYEAGESPPLEKMLTEVYFVEGVVPPE